MTPSHVLHSSTHFKNKINVQYKNIRNIISYHNHKRTRTLYKLIQMFTYSQSKRKILQFFQQGECK